VKRLVFTADALQDFQEIHDYIAKDNADTALDFIIRLQDRCNELAGFPGTGRKRNEIGSGYRSVNVGEYVIFYRLLNKDALTIMRVIQGKRDLGKIMFAE
jgi:toxin ParE1/3/4